MNKRRFQQQASDALTRVTGERYCHGHNAFTKGETKVYRGRHYCLPCTERLSATRKASTPKDKRR